MKYLVTLLGILSAGLCGALGQGVSVEILLDQDHFLPHEELIVKVRITNYSGQPLQFGKDDHWLTFNVEGRKDYIVGKLAPVPVKGEFTVESSEVATKRVNITPYFDLAKPGRYSVGATIQIAQWQRMIQAKPRSFDLFSGIKLWEQVFGVPRSSEEDVEVPEIRKYALVQANHLKQPRLYLRLTDSPENRVFRVFPIGLMLGFSNPESQVDKFSNLHILYQEGARSFNYSMVNPDGLLIYRETHDYSDTRPTLRVNREGRVGVVGGTRRYASTDLPP